MEDYTKQGYSVKKCTNYYAFGMQMAERSLNNSEYRFGFNGKENDNEVKGTGNSLDFGARIYDPRTGRFLSIDPKWRSFPSISSFAFADNNPIWNVDENGESPENGQFTNRARKTAVGISVFRITTSDRKSINACKIALYAFTGPIGAAVGLIESGHNYDIKGIGTGLVSGGNEMASAINDVSKGGNGFTGVVSGPSKLGGAVAGFDIARELTSTPTKEEFLEDETFKYIKAVFPKAEINAVNSSLTLRDKQANTKNVEENMNIAYESLRDNHLKKFDLTTESGQADATNYLNKNYKRITSDINNEIRNHIKEKNEKK